MTTVEKSIDVDVPISTAYDQWTQFESFPEFLGGVEQVTQHDDTHLHWRVKIGGVEREFDAEVTEQHPDERVAWRSTDGTTHAGVVTFHRLGDAQTRVTVSWTGSPRVSSRRRARRCRPTTSRSDGISTGSRTSSRAAGPPTAPGAATSTASPTPPVADGRTRAPGSR